MTANRNALGTLSRQRSKVLGRWRRQKVELISAAGSALAYFCKPVPLLATREANSFGTPQPAVAIAMRGTEPAALQESSRAGGRVVLLFERPLEERRSTRLGRCGILLEPVPEPAWSQVSVRPGAREINAVGQLGGESILNTGSLTIGVRVGA